MTLQEEAKEKREEKALSAKERYLLRKKGAPNGWVWGLGSVKVLVAYQFKILVVADESKKLVWLIARSRAAFSTTGTFDSCL